MARNKETKGNREYRSDVFSMLMENPLYALQVYNALNGTSHKDPAQLEIRKLHKGIYLSIRNDASFILDSYLNLYEHQSTICPNMPLRNLIYVVNIWEELVNRRDLFGSRLVKIPAPHFVVFYNGREPQPDDQILKLSDAYLQHQDNPELELNCRVININDGHSPDFLCSCRILEEYALFVHQVQEHIEKKQLVNNLDIEEKAFSDILEEAIDYCINHNILSEFLKENRREVLRVTTLDYSFEKRIQLSSEEARQEGIEQGIIQGRSEGIIQGRSEGIIQGRSEGIEQGISLLSSVFHRLKSGESIDSLKAAGIPQDIIAAASDLLK